MAQYSLFFHIGGDGVEARDTAELGCGPGARSGWTPVLYGHFLKMSTWNEKCILLSYLGLSSVLSSAFGNSCWNLKGTTYPITIIRVGGIGKVWDGKEKQGYLTTQEKFCWTYFLVCENVCDHKMTSYFTVI